MIAVDSTVPLTRIRTVIAARMHASLRGSAQLTSVVSVDLTKIMTLRQSAGDRFRAQHETGLSPLAILAHGVCRVLARHPTLNARIDVDAGTATYLGAVNLGIAVDTEAGLLVPNIKNAQALSVAGLASAIADLGHRSRTRKIKPDDLEGGTFTITNTGSRGSLLDTPILNAPEVGILAFGKIERRPVVVRMDGLDSIQIRDMSYLCLTYDHRLVDGADGARFLNALKDWLEGDAVLAEVEFGLDNA
jgi:pyruvate dehydrogenase E2 component (dihydrolipoamide acetyltransferase)